ncbi:MAG: hypothetical protein RLW62_06270, partial [Gammaproteobacteria bacterium]
ERALDFVQAGALESGRRHTAVAGRRRATGGGPGSQHGRFLPMIETRGARDGGRGVELIRRDRIHGVDGKLINHGGACRSAHACAVPRCKADGDSAAPN